MYLLVNIYIVKRNVFLYFQFLRFRSQFIQVVSLRVKPINRGSAIRRFNCKVKLPDQIGTCVRSVTDQSIATFECVSGAATYLCREKLLKRTRETNIRKCND